MRVRMERELEEAKLELLEVMLISVQFTVSLILFNYSIDISGFPRRTTGKKVNIKYKNVLHKYPFDH